MKPLKTLLTVFLFTTVLAVFANSSWSANVNKMTKEELKEIMGTETVSILDVRTGRDWGSSEYKIKGAERIDNKAILTQTKKYPKNQTLVLYCA
jgi:rhodanese-related sulfurtransferase